MKKELIYKFIINLYTDSGQMFKAVPCEHWEFPSDEEILDAIEKNGADYAEVHRVYVSDVIPFTEEE